MESVLQKFKAMKEERMKFVYETQSKKDLLLSNKFLNTINHNQDKMINIDDISNQITTIQNFISNKDEYRKHFEYYTTTFFNYFDEKFKEIYPSYDFGNAINDIKMLVEMTEELINEYSLVMHSSRDNENRNGIMNQIKENCCLLDSLLQVDYTVEKEELSRLRFYANKIKEISSHDNGNGIVDNDKEKERELLLKSMMRYASITIIKEKNTVSKSISYSEDNMISDKDNNNYDMNIFFSNNESKKSIRKCLNIIKKHLITRYFLYYNKTQEQALNQFIHYGLFGIAIKSNSTIITHITNLLKTNLKHDCLIKFSIYSSIDYLLKKNLPKISNAYLINYTFDEDYLHHFTEYNSNSNEE